MEPGRKPRADSFDTKKTMESFSSLMTNLVVKKGRVSPFRDTRTANGTATACATACSSAKTLSYWKTLIEKVRVYDIKRRIPVIQRFLPLPRLIENNMDDHGSRASRAPSEIRHSKSVIQQRVSCPVSPLSTASSCSNLSVAVPKYESDDNISHKLLCKRMNEQLALEAGVNSYVQISEKMLNDPWDPPSEHGLGNSTAILPPYYFSGHSLQKVAQLDYFDIMIDDIRNVRPLNPYQLQYIEEKCTDEEKQQIIVEFNSVIKAYGCIFLDTTDNK